MNNRADRSRDTTVNAPLGWLHSNLRLGAGRDVRLIGWLMLALAAGFLAYVARMHEITHDAFHEMCLFREALVEGQLPQQDRFAFTDTVNPSVHHEWGTGAILYLVSVGSGLGLVGLSLLKLLLMALLWLLLYRVARLRGAHPYVFACLACATFPVLWVGFATVRAQLFTLVFVAAQLWMQELDWRGRRAWILLWLVMLVAWLNLHAGFVVGLGMIALHSVERFAHSLFSKKSLIGVLGDTWHLLLAAPCAVLALQINPYGWQYIPFLVRAIGMPRPLIREWQPLWHSYAPGLTLFMFGLCIFLFVYAQRFCRVRRLKGAAFLALCSYMTLKHIRHGSIFGVVWIAYVPAWISRTSLGRELVRFIDSHRLTTIRLSQAIALGSLVFAAANHFWRPTLPPKQLYSTACYPVAAIDYLRAHNFQGNLFTPFHVGSYVSWEMYPDVKVSFDGRYEVAYQDHVMPEHNHFLNAREEWWKILEKYPTDAALVHRQAPVCDVLLKTFGDECQENELPRTKERWRVVYQDDSFIIVAPQHCSLPRENRSGETLADGAWEAFSEQHAHWNRGRPDTLASARQPSRAASEMANQAK